MLVLGWHGGWTSTDWQANDCVRRRPGVIGHDAAAVILRDGRVIAAIEEERLNRVKHCNFFPAQAIRFCLDAARATISDLDAIALDSSEDFVSLWLLQERTAGAPLPAMSGRQWIGQLFTRAFGRDISAKLAFCKHHIAHTHAAWHTSGFSRALSVCIDAVGDGPSGLITQCSGSHIKTLRQITIAHSLGYYYLRMIAVLGYRLFDEYKVMGLAPYGDPAVYAEFFQKTYQLLPQGRYALLPESQQLDLLGTAGITAIMRRKGEPFTQAHSDFAAALQNALEEIVMHMLRHFQQATGERQLCFTGGVAHNCSLNGKILRSGLFEHVHVPPAAHDAGNALGAALAAISDAGGTIAPRVMPSVYLGADLGSSDVIEQRVRDWQPLVRYEKAASPPATAARLIADGAVIAWVQGRSEFGPRALGNRSILADPRPAENKKIINAMVKKREGYRPFAPSVLQDRVRDFFELPAGTDSAPYMTIVVPVRPNVHELLGAITHVDGTARIQTVTREENPAYYALIEAFDRLTGVPIVLNTSFNNNAEPVVESVDDAITCFLTTGIHALIIGDWVIRKPTHAEIQTALLDLVPAVLPDRKLVTTSSADGDTTHVLLSIANEVFGEKAIKVSRELYQVLDAAPTLSVRERCTHLASLSAADLERLGVELFDVWQRRGISLRPAPDAAGRIANAPHGKEST